MSPSDRVDESEFPPPPGMQRWLEREISDIRKAAELRIKEATEFVDAYARGELSVNDAAHCSYEYENRWGEVLPGGFHCQGLSDQQILATIDETRVKQGLLDKHALTRRKRGPISR